MKSWSEKIEKVTNQEVTTGGGGGGGSVGWADLTGVPADSASFVIERTALEDADDALADDITTINNMLAGNLEDISDLALGTNSLFYFNGSTVDELELGTNLSITAGVLNAAAASGANQLNDLSDVTLTTVVTNDTLVHNGTRFVNKQFKFSQLADVDLTGLATGDFVKWNGTKLVPAQTIQSSESLIIIRGTVDSAGNVVNGDGFTVTVMGTGDFRIDFDTAFSEEPVVTPAIVNGLTDDFYFIKVSDISTTSARIRIQDAATADTDEDFCFVVMGI